MNNWSNESNLMNQIFHGIVTTLITFSLIIYSISLACPNHIQENRTRGHLQILKRPSTLLCIHRG